MIKIYTDAAFDLEHKIASYCLVIVDENLNKKTWEVHRVDDCPTSDYAERQGVAHALRIAGELRKGGFVCMVYCDCKGALKHFKMDASIAKVTLQHIKGHTMRDPGTYITEDLKRQHWADIMAYNYLKNVLDIISTSDNNKAVTETTRNATYQN